MHRRNIHLWALSHSTEYVNKLEAYGKIACKTFCWSRPRALSWIPRMHIKEGVVSLDAAWQLSLALERFR